MVDATILNITFKLKMLKSETPQLKFPPESGIRLEANAPLEKLTTFKLGGPAKGIIHCETPSQLELAVKTLVEKNFKFILIGGGSNLVVSDAGLPCFVIRYFSQKPLIEQSGNEIIVSGSTILDDLAQFCLEHSLEGLNFISGIPGSVGGAIVGNAGAFGKQVGDILKEVTLLSLAGEKKLYRPQNLNSLTATLF